MSCVSIAFVDEHPVVLSGLESIFSDVKNFKVLATGRCASDIVSINKLNPDIIIVDLNMTGDVFAAIRFIRRVALNTRVIVFTASAVIDHAVKALEAGATGYVLKSSSENELLGGIKTVMAGDTFITPSFASKVISALRIAPPRTPNTQVVKLSVREDQIVRLLLLGRTNKEIAVGLAISEKTVKHYMTLLMQKLHARNRVEVALAVRELDGFSPRDPSAASPQFLN